MVVNSNLQSAKAVKNDNFFTRRIDIERELRNYKSHFAGKVVFCNCDDPTSEFWRYFHLNFEFFGLKKLIATHYDSKERTYMMEYTGGNDLDLSAGVRTELRQNGDFRSEECLKLLDESDIVVTNPPFSLFREFVSVLTEHHKKFVIIGNKNAITYKELFPQIKGNQIWIGAKPMGGSLWFRTPDDFSNAHTKYFDGEKLTEVPCCWFTNLDIQKRHEKLLLWRHYYDTDGVTPLQEALASYPKYDNYQAINIAKVADMPLDYEGVMGVPITFLDKYNPDQFEILGCTESEGKGFSNGLWLEESGVAQPMIDGKKVYKRIFIKKKS